MNVATLTILGLSLSVDAFAAAMGKGAAADRPRFKDALKVGAYFGFFEAITPAFGWAMGLAVSSWFAAVDHWIAFGLLAAVGGNMIRQGLSTAAEEEAPKKGQFGPMQLILTALATSIDATAVGVGLAVVDVNIVLACVIIGTVSGLVATTGVMIGKKAGPLLGRRAEILGGVALIGIGIKILIEHMA